MTAMAPAWSPSQRQGSSGSTRSEDDGHPLVSPPSNPRLQELRLAGREETAELGQDSPKSREVNPDFLRCVLRRTTCRHGHGNGSAAGGLPGPRRGEATRRQRKGSEPFPGAARASHGVRNVLSSKLVFLHPNWCHPQLGLLGQASLGAELGRGRHSGDPRGSSLTGPPGRGWWWCWSPGADPGLQGGRPGACGVGSPQPRP